MHRRLFRIGSTAAVAAAVATALGSGVAFASPLDDDGGNGNGGQSGSSADSGYSGYSPGSSYSGYQSQSEYPSDSGLPGGSTNRSNPTDGVLNGLSSPAAPANAGSGVTPNGFSPGQTLPGGSLGGL
ncbi:MAG TPA: hypothetical protein VFE65_28855 [Pseudonocardia sp.]|jgi:hypothetical protein|nr:hypothetical protein [Pseudonocardia sp.]